MMVMVLAMPMTSASHGYRARVVEFQSRVAELGGALAGPSQLGVSPLPACGSVGRDDETFIIAAGEDSG